MTLINKIRRIVVLNVIEIYVRVMRLLAILVEEMYFALDVIQSTLHNVFVRILRDIFVVIAIVINAMMRPIQRFVIEED